MRTIILSFIILLSACSTKPWSVIDGSSSKETDNKNYDVFITGIDGKLYFDDMKSRSMDPGFHYLRLTTTKPNRNGHHTYANFPIVTKPCVRYIVTAQHKSGARYNNKVWEVKVLREEPIKSCLQLLQEQKEKELSSRLEGEK